MDADTVAGGKRRIQEIVENCGRALSVIAPANPAAGAGLIAFIDSFRTVIRRVAQQTITGTSALTFRALACCSAMGLR